MTIETFHLSENQNTTLRKVLELLKQIESNGGNGKVFIEVSKKIIEVKGTIHLSEK